MERVQTGSRMLDAALAGGIAPGCALLLRGEEGAGATEFALAFLRHSVEGKSHAHARFLSALRSPNRVRAEIHELFNGPDAKDASDKVDVRRLDAEKACAAPDASLDGLEAGDAVVIESADALAPSGNGQNVASFWRSIADDAGERGVIVLLLHSPGTLPAGVEAALAEAADGIIDFSWHQSGQMRKRVLSLVKLRGLAPGVDGGEVPLFDLALHRGNGFEVSRGRSVL